jgi:hypothetical protein
VIGLPHYLEQDAATCPGVYASLYLDLPRDPAQLREIVSRLIIHVSRISLYGIPPDAPTARDTLPIAERLKLTQALSPGSLLESRAASQRSFGTCRDYALVLCSMLRHHAIPARVRCGFATYLTAGAYEDHWICEYWSGDARRWIRLDALDQLQRDRLAIGFDCADLPSDVFVSAGKAWTLARSGDVSPDAFGHGDAKGWWFLRVNVHRDLLALTNQYMSRWDTWRLSTPTARALNSADMATVDELVAQSEAIDRTAGQFGALRATAARCQVPPWEP